jgi:hypothetical protein
VKDAAIVLLPVSFYFCCNSVIAAILVDNQLVANGSKMAELQQIMKNALFDDVFE